MAEQTAEVTAGTTAAPEPRSFQDRARLATLRYKTLPTNKKILFLLGIIALIIILIAIFWRGPAVQRTLFSNLSDKDAGQISAILDQMGVSYTISPGGVISVPESMVYKLRTQLAVQGFPKTGGVGFELLDEQKFGISQFAEQVNYQRALEGELARTIEAFNSVERARVHVAIPKSNVFLRQQQKTTASVMVDLLPGRILDQSQIAGILNLVSSSIPNLNVKDIAIVDQNGDLLTNDSTNNYQNLSEQQVAQVKRIEDSYVDKIQKILAPIFGSNNVRAQVTATLDFSVVEQTAETYTPNSPPNQSAIRSRQLSEQQKREPSANSGVPGTLSNQPPDAAAAPVILPQGTPEGVTVGGENGNLLSSSKEDTTNYELDRTVQHTKLPVGVLKRLTAAVVVNNKKAINPQTGAEELVALSPAELENIESLVKEAIGYSEARSDTVRVVNTEFAEIPGVISLQDRIFDYVTMNIANIIKYGLLIILLFYVLFAILRPIINSILEPTPVPEVEYDQHGIPISDITGEPLDEREIQRRLYNANLEAARQIVRNDPRMAAQIIREWVGE